MKDSQGNIILPGMKLKSSESEKCIPAIEMVSEEVFRSLTNPSREPFRMNQSSMTNSKWIIVKEISGRINGEGE